MSTPIPGYVRDAAPGEEWRETSTPEGFHLVVVDELLRNDGWVAVHSGQCRWGGGRRHPMCGRPAVVGLWRRHGTHQRRLWRYCEEHTYGRVWDGERLLTTVLVTDGAA